MTPDEKSLLPAPRLAGLVLAAGEGRRFGGPKPAHRWQGESLVLASVQRLQPVCGAGIVVVTGAHREAVQAALAGAPVRVVHHAGWAEGMGSSIAAGVRALGEVAADALLLLPCDLYALTTADLARLAAAWQQRPEEPAVARFTGRLGPPAVFPRSWWPALGELRGDSGARALIGSGKAVSMVDIPAAALDADTPADLPGG